MTQKQFFIKNTSTLYEGSCLDLLKQIPDKSVQLIVTSPPYNVGKEYEKKTNLEKYLKFQEEVITECVRVLKDEGSICWQVGNYVDDGEIIPLDVLFYPIFSKLGLQMRNRIIWHFGHGLHAKKRFSGRYETINWFTKTKNYFFDFDSIRVPQKYPNKKHFKGSKKGQLSCNPLGKNPSDIWEIPNVKNNHIEKTIHPCQFPVELVERLVLSMTKINDLVLDPFIGSGTTAVASLIHARRIAGAEIEKKYIEIAKKRIDLALNKKIKFRPMNREIYNPNFSTKQGNLFERANENYL